MVVVLMGVAGCGKSTVGKTLANRINAHFIEGDDAHSQSNIAKMKAGVPLDDRDRLPWLEALRQQIAESRKKHSHTVVACSALKTSYRKALNPDQSPDFHFAFLQISPSAAAERLKKRRNHYMPAQLLDSQFATLEPPTQALLLDGTLAIVELVQTLISHLEIEPAEAS